MTSFFPDVNTWLALGYRAHVHSGAATEWFDGLQDGQAFFSRVTQLGLLRLLTQPAVMGPDTMGAAQAWAVFDSLLADGRIGLLGELEPLSVEKGFRELTLSAAFGHGHWNDSYLAAFARSAGLILVTFDRGLARRAQPYARLLA